jgi:hypothetical protein
MKFRNVFSFLIKFFLLLVFCILSILYIHRIDSYFELIIFIRTILSEQTHGSNICKKFLIKGSLQFKCLPTIFFIGASKCGTTTIVNYLKSSNKVAFVSRRIVKKDKHDEVHRFDRNSFAWTIQSIELAKEWASCPVIDNKHTPVIHYTPHYIYAPTVPFDVREFYPSNLINYKGHLRDDLKFIILLREPVNRAFSSYWFKNSKLLNKDKDSGSLDEFNRLIDSEVSTRDQFNKCMNNRYWLANFNVALYNLSTSALVHILNISSNKHGRELLLNSLTICFGKKLRSSSLGTRHFDKGIYFDQLYRWLLNFHPKSFQISFIDFWNFDKIKNFKLLTSFIGFNVSEEVIFNLVTLKDKLTAPNSIGKNISELVYKWKLLVSRNSNEFPQENLHEFTPKNLQEINKYFHIENKLKSLYFPYNILFVKLLKAMGYFIYNSNSKLNYKLIKKLLTYSFVYNL